MSSEDLQVIFTEYVRQFLRGERPDTRASIVRAGERGEELAELIDTFLASAPPPEPTAAAVELAEAWIAGQPPLLELRVQRGIGRDEVVAALVGRLGLASETRAKVKRYLHELETGLLDPAGVSRRVFGVMSELYDAAAGELAAWRPRSVDAISAQSAYLRTDAVESEHEPVLPHLDAGARDQAEWDEVDELFRGGH